VGSSTKSTSTTCATRPIAASPGKSNAAFTLAGSPLATDQWAMIAGVRSRSMPSQPNGYWIFTRYAEGWSCQRIAAELNKLCVRSPRETTWCVSVLYGSPAKGSGMLNNELYVGRYIWNRSQWVKEPDTGKRQRIDRRGKRIETNLADQ
jgi:hypothetical protein